MLKLFIELLSLIGGTLIYLLTTLGSELKIYFIHLWILIVSILGIYIGLTFLLFLGVFLLGFIAGNDKHKEGRRYKLWVYIFNHFIHYLNQMAGIKVKIKGLDKIPNEKCMIVYNHKSNFDPMLIAWYLRKCQLISISKHANFDIPICGPFMKAMDYIEINRESAREGALTISKAIKYITSDTYSICIAPEGTRNKTEEILLPFHSGSFKIATKSKCPIIVLCMTNTFKIHKNFPFKKTKVAFEILDVLYYDDYKDLTTTEISDNIREQILNRLLEENK